MSPVNMIFGIGFPISISFVLNSLKGLINFSSGLSGGGYTLIITILRFCMCMSWYSTYYLHFAISCSVSTASDFFYLRFFLPKFDLHEIQSYSSFVSPSQVFFISVFQCDGQCIFIICQFSDISCTLCFCFFVLSPWMFQLIIEYKMVCPGSWSWAHHCHHVVHLLLDIVHHFP